MSPLQAPVVLAQGLWVRLRTEVLPVANGATSGMVGDAMATEPWRIAVLGESTAAGCGVETHEEGFAGAFARALSRSSRRSVAWDVVGEHGATARRIRYRLLQRLPDGYDLAILLAGANDVLARRTATEWSQDLTAILDGLASRARHVVVMGTPPFTSFPSLPYPLSRYLAHRAAAIDKATEQVCAGRAHVDWISSTDDLVGQGFFARDGFHPSAHGYERWAEIAAEKLSL